MIIATRFSFFVQRGWKKDMCFHPKMAWPPTTYDVITCNHCNWPSLNLSQNAREGWTNSYWKRRVLTFYPLGKNSEKPYDGGIHPPFYVVRGLISLLVSSGVVPIMNYTGRIRPKGVTFFRLQLLGLFGRRNKHKLLSIRYCGLYSKG